MILVAGLPAERADILNAVPQRLSLDVALPRPASVQGHHVVIPVVHVDTRRVHPGQIKMRTARVCHPHAPRDHVGVLKYRVEQFDLHIYILVLADQPQCLALLVSAERRRQSLKRRLSLDDLMRHVGEHAPHMPVRRPHTDAALPEIAQSVRRVLERKTVIKRTALPVVSARNERRLPRPHQIGRLRFLQFLSIINMSDKVFLVHDPDHVGCAWCVQLEHTLFFIV